MVPPEPILNPSARFRWKSSFGQASAVLIKSSHVVTSDSSMCMKRGGLRSKLGREYRCRIKIGQMRLWRRVRDSRRVVMKRTTPTASIGPGALARQNPGRNRTATVWLTPRTTRVLSPNGETTQRRFTVRYVFLRLDGANLTFYQQKGVFQLKIVRTSKFVKDKMQEKLLNAKLSVGGDLDKRRPRGDDMEIEKEGQSTL